MTQSRAPLIVAILLLLLPVLYVGSYLALVDPYCRARVDPSTRHPFREPGYIFERYRIGGKLCERIFWPLEQVDYKLRPKMWEPSVKNITWAMSRRTDRSP
jgi:hypothetical protein